MTDNYSDKIFHHPCRIFRDYFATQAPHPQALDELFYGALFAHFIKLTLGDEAYVQVPVSDPPDVKLIAPYRAGDLIKYRDIEIFDIPGMKKEEDVLSAARRKMSNKFYGKDYVLVGVPQSADPVLLIDPGKLHNLFKSEKFSLGHIFFVFPSVYIKDQKHLLQYVMIQVQPTFFFKTLTADDLMSTCSQMVDGFFFELGKKGKKTFKSVTKEAPPELLPPNKRHR